MSQKDEPKDYYKKIEKNVDKCMNTKLWERLKPDCQSGQVFASFRSHCESDKEVIDFYRFNNLFSFEQNRFFTHYKYALHLRDGQSYVTEEDLENAKLVTDFYEGYDEIKKTIKKYAGPETEQRTPMIQKLSYSNSENSSDSKNKSQIVVLDVEFGFLGLPGKDPDFDWVKNGKTRHASFNVDITLYDPDTNTIRFVEVKRLSDERLCGATRAEDVTLQIEKYHKATSKNCKEIARFYAAYIAAARKMFGTDVLGNNPKAPTIDDRIGLLVCEYDDAQYAEKTSKDMPFWYGVKNASICEVKNLDVSRGRLVKMIAEWWKNWDKCSGEEMQKRWTEKHKK